MQVLTGYECLNYYIQILKLRQSKLLVCICGVVDIMEHTLLIFSKCKISRDEINVLLETELDATIILNKMLENTDNWQIKEKNKRIKGGDSAVRQG